jgi:alkanesulfonate monooxygenase SsuD/methylene tetrahydromethanopterin reductase-like flavin-dependent oxidoreductase (luciferase family)
VTYAFDAAAHHPSWLAKRAVAVDHLSGGRLDLRLAVGAEGSAAQGWAAHGIRYPAPGTRIETLEESVRVMRGLWQTHDGFDHRGPRYELRGARLGTAPVQRPGPPIWIAAMGPRALALTARCADGWEASYVSPADFATRWQRLSTLLAAERRPADALLRSVELDAIATEEGGPLDDLIDRFRVARGLERGHPLLDTVLAGDGTALAGRMASYEGAGATDLMLGFADFPSTGMLETFAATVLQLHSGSRGGTS